MRKSVLIRTLILISLLAAILIACRRDEEADPGSRFTDHPCQNNGRGSGASRTDTNEGIAPTATPKPAAAIAPEDIDWSPQVIASNPAPAKK